MTRIRYSPEPYDLIHLTFLNWQFGLGGAERQLIELLKHIDKRRFSVSVITFYDHGILQPEAEAIEGIHLINLKKRGRYDIISFLWRLWRAVRSTQPHIVHGYQEAANVLALLIGRLSGSRVAWGIRASDVNPAQYRWTFRLSIYLQNILGRFADLVIANSHAGRSYYLSRGFSAMRITVISNGIDTHRFHPDAESRRRTRAEWNIKDNVKLIGVVGRLDPMKDHPTFLNAAALLAQEMPEIRFSCVGDGPAQYREELQHHAQALGLAQTLIWTGNRSDMAAVYNALDIVTSSSQWGEGFPNVIGEAMACGVPCVVTNVGDSAMLVGDTGIVVPPCDPRALADGWKSMLERPNLGTTARKRIVAEFGVDRLAERTADVLLALAQN